MAPPGLWYVPARTGDGGRRLGGSEKRLRLRGEAGSTHPDAARLYPAPNPVPDPSKPLVHVAEPSLGELEERYVREVMESRFVSSAGAMVGRFEAALAEACGSRHALAVTCGTHALDLLMYALDVGPGDEVVVPDLTFLSVATCVARAGARPVFADVDRRTLNVTAAGIEAALTPRTRGVIAVHTYGHPCDLDAIREVTDPRGLFLVEDACEALGATLRGRPAGGLGDAAVHSFYANKMITTGNGGAITTSHEGLVALLRELRGYSYAPGRFFWHAHTAWNVRMSALQAALGLAQVERLPELVRHHAWLAERYGEGLRDVPGVVLPSPAEGGGHVYWMYTIHVEPEAYGRDAFALRTALAAEGLETRPVFSPLHVQPVLQEAAAPVQGPFPNAEWAALTGINLPSGKTLTEESIERVCRVVREAARP